ncbi:cytochrome P450 [Schizophyllum fasciatum]
MAPPGPVFLLKILPRLVYPSVIAYGCLRVFGNVWQVEIPGWLGACAIVLVHPVLWTVQGVYRELQTRDKANVAAADLPPLVPSDLPWGLSHLLALRKSAKEGLLAYIFDDWAKKVGSTVYRVNLQGDVRIVTLEPDHIKAILATRFEDFDKGPVLYDLLYSLLGSGVFNSDGEMWKFHRTMTRPFFNKEKIAHFDNFDRHADDIIRQAKKRLTEGHPIDFQDMVSRFTLDSATEFLFGHDVNSAGAGLPYPPGTALADSPEFLNHPSNRFVHAFAEGQDMTAMRSRAGAAWRMLEFWKDQVKPCRDVVNDFVREILADPARPKEDIEAKEGAPETKVREDDSLLDHLLKFTQDRNILTDEIVNLLVAGRDTTAGTLTYGIYKLAEHPDIAEKLRAEILEKVGPTRRPTYDDIRDMKYLRAFLNGALRHKTCDAPIYRTANKDTLLPYKSATKRPIFVAKGTRCLYSVFLMHRRTDLWGPDGESLSGKFDPDRFIDERLHKYLTHNPYIFVPFNAGPRICLGQQFAYNEMSFFLIRLLQNFSGFTLAHEAQPQGSIARFHTTESPESELESRVFAAHLTMYLKDGLWVRMTEASEREK